jgi:hypothetical protein
MNILIPAFVAALIPLIIGMVWYHPKVMGNTWMTVNGFTMEEMDQSGMAKKMVVLYVFSLMIALALLSVVIHQFHLDSLIANIPDADGSMKADMEMIKSKYGNNFRTFKHGAFHGFIASLFIAMPLIGISTMFEKRGWKYVAVHAGYWAVCMMLMGGLLSAWN